MKEYHGEADWFKTLKKIMNPVFSKEQFNRYLKRHKEKLNFYKRFIKGKKVLDIGSGFGYTAVSLSALGFDVTAIDNNLKVIKSLKENATLYGKNMKVIKGDLFNIDKMFESDSFDASISGGLYEHFIITDIRKIVNKQLKVAKVIIADIPIHSDKKTLKQGYKDYKRKICLDGVYRNLWDENFWVNNILKNYKVTYHKINKSSKNTGEFEKLTIVIERKV